MKQRIGAAPLHPLPGRHAFTIIELGVLLTGLVVAAIVVSIVSDWHPWGKCRRCGDRSLKDSTQLRAIMQGMAVWAQNNKDEYPLPSLFDLNDTTVAEKGSAKDTSGNIMSILVANGFCPVDMFISPLESNPNIKVKENYEFDKPSAAADPAKALWDPSFTADFTGTKPGNLSYAHLQPLDGHLDGRLRRQTPRGAASAFTVTGAILSNRGPEIAGVTKRKPPTVTPIFANPKSRTLGIGGPKGAWSGNVAFNDNHTSFESSMLKPGSSARGGGYRDLKGNEWTDVLFYDEPDDPRTFNSYLGLFIKAGDTPKDYKAIWD